ncbi:MAG TPA: Y-family DNA polymerase [Stenomitos sp.]
MLALCDCNSFYASCEVVFAPHLQGKPVIVLSNNDGAVVARSLEAKRIGIPMGEPLFKIQHLIKQHHVQVFSSNYSLYGDMSQRVMQALAQFTPELEIYSIDEAFLSLDNFRQLDFFKHGLNIKATVHKWTGIPVSIGIAPTKVLAKVAGDLAKKDAQGVFLLPEQYTEILAATPIADIWGIGRSHSKSLPAYGIETALDLRNANLNWIKQRYGVVMQRLVLELRGQRCFELELSPPTKKTITVSRSFSQKVTELSELKEAVATYTSRACEKLRRFELTTDALQIFVRTSHFEQTYYGNSITLSLPSSSDSTPEVLHFALKGCERIYRPGERYAKAGVILLGLRPKSERQLSLWDAPATSKSDALMQVIDSINQQFGKGAIRFAAAGLKQTWSMKQERRSPRYTTRWDELPQVKAR